MLILPLLSPTPFVEPMFAYGLSSFSCAQQLSRMNTPGSRQMLAALWQAPSVAGVNSAAMRASLRLWGSGLSLLPKKGL